MGVLLSRSCQGSGLEHPLFLLLCFKLLVLLMAKEGAKGRSACKRVVLKISVCFPYWRVINRECSNGICGLLVEAR